MKTALRTAIPFAAAALIFAFPVQDACGQAARATTEKPSFDDLQSPQYSGGKQKSFKPKDWLEMEAKIRVAMRPAPKSNTCEKLTVKWYVLVKNPDGKGFLLLSKDVEHVNVPLDEDVYVSSYLSPGSIRKLTGSDRGTGKRAIEAVAYEVLVNGERVGWETTKFGENWWSTARDDISRTDAVPLLNKSETPFAFHWWDRYAEVAPK